MTTAIDTTTNTGTDKKAKAIVDPLPNPFHVEGFIVPQPFGGLSDKELDKPIKEGVRYYLNTTMFKRHPDNVRMWDRGAEMAPKIKEDGGIKVNLELIVRGDKIPTLRQIINGEVTPIIGKGHCRTDGVEVLARTDPEFYTSNLQDRIPVVFHLNPSKTEELTILHDHAGVNALTRSEVCHQLGLMLKTMGLTEATWSLKNLLTPLSKEAPKIAQLGLQHDRKEITGADYRKRVLAILHGLAQEFEAVSKCPREVKDFYYRSYDPVLCVKHGTEFPKARLGKLEYQELATLASNPFIKMEGDRLVDAIKRGLPSNGDSAKPKYRRFATFEEAEEACLARFKELVASKVAAKTGDTTTEGGDDGPVGRAMSAKEIEQKLPHIESRYFKRILEGIAGDRTAREEWPGIDAELFMFERAMKADSDKVRALLAELAAA